jgi:hypothetical protein
MLMRQLQGKVWVINLHQSFAYLRYNAGAMAFTSMVSCCRAIYWRKHIAIFSCQYLLFYGQIPVQPAHPVFSEKIQYQFQYLPFSDTSIMFKATITGIFKIGNLGI